MGRLRTRLVARVCRFQKLFARGYRHDNRRRAGAILAMLSDTMIPEAFEETHDYAGPITVTVFLPAFVLTKLQ